MKKLLFFLIGIVALLAVCVAMLPQFISPDMIKTQLTQHVESSTGRILKIDGALSLKVFPNLAIEAEKVSLSNPAGFETDTFLSLKKMRVSVALAPLLNKEVQITQFKLTDPVIDLRVNRDGRANWRFTPTKSAKQEAAQEAAKEATKDSADNGMPAGLVLGDIAIENGTLTYTDDLKKEKQALGSIHANLSVSSLQSPLQFRGSASWQGKLVNIEAGLDSLATILDNKPATFTVLLKSDLLNVESKGEWRKDSMNASTSVQSSSLKALMAWIQPDQKPMTLPSALSLELSANAAYTPDALELSKLSVTLDHIKGQGDAKISLSGSRPSLSLNLKTNELNLNPFMTQDNPKSSLSMFIRDAHAQNPQWSAAPIDLSGLRAFDVAATVETPQVEFKQIKLQQITIKSLLRQGRLSIDIPKAGIYGGNGDVSLVADAAQEPAAFELNADMTGVDIAALLNDASQMDRIAGKGALRFAVKSRGESQAQIVQALNGSGNLSISEGELRRMNLLGMLRNVSSAFGGVSNDATPFTRMDGTFTIQGGVISNQDLLITLSGARVDGTGTIDLPNYAINYRLSPKTVGKTTDAEGNTTERKGLEVPVLITGSLNAPSFQPDLQSTIQKALTDPKALKQELKNSKKDLKEQFIKQPKEAVKNVKDLLKAF